MGFAQQGGYFVQALPQPTRFFGQGMRGGGQQRWPQPRQSNPGVVSFQGQYRNPRPAHRMSQAMSRPMGGAQSMVPIMAAAPRPGMPPQAMQMQAQPLAVIGAPQIRGATNYKFAHNVRNPAQVSRHYSLSVYSGLTTLFLNKLR